MRSTTFCVHLGLSDHTIPLSPAHEFQALLGIFHNNLVESLYVDTVLFVLVNQQFLLFSCFRVLFKQICHFLVVKLQEGAVDFDMFPAFLHQLIEEEVDSPGNESSVILILLYAAQKSSLFPSLLAVCLSLYDVTPITAEHRMRLAAPCLSISEEGDIESFHNLIE